MIETQALHIAAQRGVTKGVRLLLDQPDIDANPRDNEGNTPLSLAMQNQWRHEEGIYEANANSVVQPLFAHGGSAWNKGVENGLLWRAMLYGEEGDEQLTQKLLQIGPIELNEQSTTGSTLIHYASSKGYESFVRTLLNKGADIEAEDYANHQTTLHYAVRYKKL
jgi:ankyrin repeat protein